MVIKIATTNMDRRPNGLGTSKVKHTYKLDDVHLTREGRRFYTFKDERGTYYVVSEIYFWKGEKFT